MSTNYHDTSYFLLLCKTIRRDKLRGMTREQVLHDVKTYEPLRTTSSQDLRTVFKQAVHEVFQEESK